ncbi:hypothetical protein Tdes44962_MAKER07289 [Teratosphaeria destructans]|uniref:Uncharacterized protein n=1 Tax=Teratosphaeria destructans TaxID=418781 RepID=A0A9W7SZD0_9PEZI|nr:hypothetical protein Tdes44962_MAKER07289 [Teratosphaeria destructans]
MDVSNIFWSALETGNQFIQEYPWLSILIALLTGPLLGLVLFRLVDLVGKVLPDGSPGDGLEDKCWWCGRGDKLESNASKLAAPATHLDRVSEKSQ